MLTAVQESELTGPTAVSLEENSADAIGYYSVTGVDGAQITWSITGVDADAFVVADGALEFVETPDFEKPTDDNTDNVYIATVTAADGAGHSVGLEVTVTINDVNDPSIVLVMADDAGYEVFGAYGSSQYSTPSLDAIAAAGSRFNNAFSLPSCPSTRVALMTGKHNVRNYAAWGNLPAHEYTIGNLFIEAGYATATAGKWQLHKSVTQTATAGTYAGAGFDTYCLWHTEITASDSQGLESRYYNPVIACDGTVIDTGDSDYGPDIFAGFIEEFIEANQRKPFFVYYPMVLPHGPRVLPPGSTCDSEDDEQCIYETMVNRTDHNVGRIYAKLESLGLLENTIVMFTADNGTNGR